MANSINGKKAIITGAGKGIGRSTALALAKEGVALGLIARTEADLQNVAEEAKAEGVQVYIATADVSKNEEVIAAVEHVIDVYGYVVIILKNDCIDKLLCFLLFF